MSKHAYTVRVTREGKWWMIEVPDLDILTQARRLSEVEDMARSAIAVTKDVAPSSFEMRVEITAIEDIRITEWMDQLSSSREELEAAREKYRNGQRSLANRLAKQGLTVRDIGAVLGVSYQRAQQLINAK